MWGQLGVECMSATWSLHASARPTSASVLVLADLSLQRLNGGQWQKTTTLVKVLTPQPPTVKHRQQLSQNLSLTRQSPFAYACGWTCRGGAACVVAGKATVVFPSDCPYQRHRHLSFLLAFLFTILSANHPNCASGFRFFISFLA